MIIFLYGPDTYRSRKKLNEIIGHYKKIHKSGLNLRYLNLKEKNFQDLKDEFWSTPMFGEKKLIILEEAFSNNDFKEKFLKSRPKIWGGTDNVILFYEREALSKNDPFLNFLEKQAKSQRFDFLAPQKLKNWVKEEFKNWGGKIEESALQKLIDFVGNDSWQFSNEIKKLISFKMGQTSVTTVTKVCPEIEREDVEILVKPRIESDIFATIDKIAEKDKKAALRLIHQHLEKGDSPSYLLSMINFQFRNLLIIKSLSQKYSSYYPILKVSGLHPFVAKKAYFQAQKFGLEELKKIYQKLFEIDLDIKTGKIEPAVALDLLISEI